MSIVRRWMAALALALAASDQGLIAADQQPVPGQQPVPIEERARGAERVVVATVADVSSRYERNEFGDELIVSRATLALEEVLKGTTEPATLVYEGGTVDGITLHVSSLPALARGERAVFFMTRGKQGELRPHLRGQGILKLDRTNHVQGSSLTLDDVRRMSRGQGPQGGGN
jgi:hypothetical protein